MKVFGYEIKLIIKKVPKLVEPTVKEKAEKIFTLMEYLYETGPYKESKQYEVSPEVFEEIKKLAREDYLENITLEDLDEDELEEYHNPETSFYSFHIIETKPNGNIVFNV